MSRNFNKLRSSLLSVGLLMFMVLSVSCSGAINDLPQLADDSENEAATNPGIAPLVPPGQEDGGVQPVPPNSPAADQILDQYQHLDPQRVIDSNLLRTAVLYFDANKSRFNNRKYITVIDFKKRSSARRMHIVDMTAGTVWSMPVAHGKGSDRDGDGYANSFSNVAGSNASSLGFYRGAETYIGSNGLSLRLDGLSSTNSNARPRAIVIHGAAYVQDAEVIQGRSWGCPAVPLAYRDRVMAMLKGGTLVYAGLSN